jgi:hypothetical protein
MRDLYWIVKITLISLLALCILSCIYFPPASANDDLAGDVTIVENPTSYPYHEPYRIVQGQEVYVNDTIDISGQGWGSGLAWYGKYSEYDLPQYIYVFTPYKHDVQNFYLNPDLFATKTGMWYQYYGNTSEPRGNTSAFKVINAFRNYTMILPNGTTLYSSIGIFNETPQEIKVSPPILPEVHKSDFLISHGDPLVSNINRIWIFGRVDGLYGRFGNLSSDEINKLESGSYTLVQQEKGNNTIIDVGYNPAIDSFWRSEYDITVGPRAITSSIKGSQPRLNMEKFYNLIRYTDDKIQTYSMEVEDPMVSVVRIDEVDVGLRIPISYELGMTLLDVRGYTNAQNGTVITLVMDPDKQTVRTLKGNTYTTVALRSSPGNMSIYQCYIPINKNQMPNGIHTVKVSAALGGSMLHDFVISELPADSYVPNATLKYIGDRNPWVPTPTPEVVTVVQTKVVEKIVTVEVTPPQEMLNEAQKRAVDDKVGEIVKNAAIAIGIVIALFLVGRFAYRVYTKRKWYKE